ncbi:MAG: hypothetical protein ACREML_04710, partial [Vulcanimicrobiaceae bacterium]
DHVAELLGIERSGHRMLDPVQLIEKYDAIFDATQRYLRVFPPEQIGMTVPRRDKRDMRELGHHVFAIADDLMTVREGDTYRQGNAPIPDAIRTFEDILAYGEGVRNRLRDWYGGQSPELWREIRTTSYGAFPMHLYLERATWHSAQHSRQIVEMLRLAGIAAPDPLPPSFFAGLPLPAGIWE